MASPRTVLLRNAAGSLTVLGVVLAVAAGLPALNRLLPGGLALGPEPYLVGAGVRVRPPAGAQLDVGRTRPGTDRGTALFTVDGVRYVVVVDRYSGSLPDAAQRLRHKITQTAGYQVTDGELPVRTAEGVPGTRGGYTSPDRRGGYAVFVARGLVVEVTASGSELQASRVAAAIDHSIASVTFGDAR
jgi:hypothetical protein